MCRTATSGPRQASPPASISPWRWSPKTTAARPPHESPDNSSSTSSDPADRPSSRFFKAQVGITAADHVETVRMESACRLLETTNSSIEQVARACGFGTPETMNRTFRRRLATTPGAHRHHFQDRAALLAKQAPSELPLAVGSVVGQDVLDGAIAAK